MPEEKSTPGRKNGVLLPDFDKQSDSLDPPGMAKTTITRVTDDLDGSSNAEEVLFAYNGVEYTIDLNKKNRAALEKALRTYVQAGTRVSARSTRRRGKAKALKTEQNLAEVRAWAKENGMKVSDRGRVSAEVMEAFSAR